jgi:Tfp pilus assembly protein PilV
MRITDPIKGFALLEALVGLLIVASATAGAMHLHMAMAHHSEVVHQRVQAITMAQQTMELLRTRAATSMPPDHTDQTSPSTAYNVYTKIQPTNAPTLHQVHISVAWQDRQGKDHQVILESFITPPQALYSALLTMSLSPPTSNLQAPAP